MYLLFLPPPSLPIDPETDAAADAPVIDYIPDDPSFQQSFQASKTPLIIRYHPFSSLLCLH